MSGKIDSDKITISRLFSDFWFVVPSYQRHYVWEYDDVQALLDDIYSHHENNLKQDDNNKEEYFLGSLVLQKHSDGSTCDVLDGQQRLTTLLLILSVIRDLTENLDNCASYLKEEAKPTKRIYTDKNRIEFEIRDNIKDFVKKFIYEYKGGEDLVVKYTEIEEYKNSKNISLKNMSNAIITIKDFLNNLTKENLKEFFATLLNDVVLIYVSTKNKEDAYRLFTILNSRGVPLSNAD